MWRVWAVTLLCLAGCSGRPSAEGGASGSGSSGLSSTDDASSTGPAASTGSATRTSSGDDPGLPEDCTLITEEQWPQAAADLQCRRFFDCGCEDPDLPATYEQCMEIYVERAKESQQIAKAAGSHYDPNCLCITKAELEYLGCKTYVELPMGRCSSDPNVSAMCPAYYGDTPHGGECPEEEGNNPNRCGRGLLCGSEGVCVGPGEDYYPDVLEEGSAPCMDETFNGQASCETGTICDPQIDTCRSYGRIGDPCEDIDQCDPCRPGNRCDSATGTCVEGFDVGDECEFGAECKTRICGRLHVDEPDTCLPATPIVCP